MYSELRDHHTHFVWGRSAGHPWLAVSIAYTGWFSRHAKHGARHLAPAMVGGHQHGGAGALAISR
jgi:hypothetical protein